jgi:2-polyprenyl-3-methyl-5-hydroxy-6-metoxy-1,4-benzoquinol methylase
MNRFYRLLATHYDRLFPAEPQIVNFLAKEFQGAQTLMDAACGTGNYTDALAARGFDCRGFDASEEMIEVAGSRGKRGQFEVRDLRRLRELARGDRELLREGRELARGDRELFRDGREPAWDRRKPARDGGDASRERPTEDRDATVSGLFCIGNSLPHLADRDQVWAFFRDAAALLSPGARLVVQTVNFSRFVPHGTEAPLPAVEHPEITMRRSYRQADAPGTVLFHVELVTAGGETAAADTQLLTLDAEELTEAARAAGFRHEALFGSYERDAYQRESSFLQVLSARRR